MHLPYKVRLAIFGFVRVVLFGDTVQRYVRNESFSPHPVEYKQLATRGAIMKDET